MASSVAAEIFPLEAMGAMPAPPAQFNNSSSVERVVGTVTHDDESLGLAGENVALIRSPAMKGNGHATILR